jgi:hypothetical protein
MFPSFGKGKKEREKQRSSKMTTHQIEATIEKLEQDSSGNLEIQLKGAGKYLFEKKKDEKYWNILEADDTPEKSKLVDSQKKFKIAVLKNKLGMQYLLGYAFAEKKKLKFDLLEEKDEYTITAISHAST